MPVLKFILKKWLKFVVWFADIQMILIVSIVYWLILPFSGVIVALVTDPLGRRLENQSTWQKRDSIADPLEDLKQQG